MRHLKQLWRDIFELREDERLPAFYLAVYLFFVLIVHYINKPLSEGLFVNKFEIDRLPYLTILTAVAGGLLMSVYTRIALRASLRIAVSLVMSFAIVFTFMLWWLVSRPWNWVLYVFSVWSAMFGVVVVAQGYVIASNVFTSRQAKRVYGLLGLGATFGSLVGAGLVSLLVERIGHRGLLLACVPLIGLAYLAFYVLTTHPCASLVGAKGAQKEEASVSAREMFTAAARNRHLRLIATVITFVFIVDELVKFQWNVAAKAAYQGDALIGLKANVAFFTNLITFLLQFVLTGFLVMRLGVGGTLKLMPASISLASLGSLFWPGVPSTTATRLVESASRYSFNKTGTELLYLPLPVELRNRTKAFMDVFMDRMARGIAGTLLIVLGWLNLQRIPALSVLVIGLSAAWLVLSGKAQKEYILTIRKRLDARRLDLESVRTAVTDPALLSLLEQTARSANPRQACYALSVLAEAPGYRLEPLLGELPGSPLAEVRSVVYDLARSLRFDGLFEPALAEARAGKSAAGPAVRYVLSLSPNPIELAREFLNHPDPTVVENTLRVLPDLPEPICRLVSPEWIAANASHAGPDRRRLAAVAIGVCGDQGTDFLHRLLRDGDTQIVAAACQAAGALRKRDYFGAVVSRLADPRLRGVAVAALAAYEARICGALGDILEDPDAPVAVRCRIPRVLRLIAGQRSVDVLLRSMNEPSLLVRAAVLKALNRLRETDPALDYGPPFVTRQILEEARLYYCLNAALEPLRGHKDRRTAAGLLAASIEDRLKQTLERLFRLLGLRFPPKQVYAAYLGVHRRRGDQYSVALDFLENVLDRELKNVLLPLLEDSAHLAERARDLYGVDIASPTAAIRSLIASGDPWLAPCAMAAAAELKLRDLTPGTAPA